MDEATKYLVLMAVATPIIIGLVQLLKGMGLPVRWAPIAAIALGCGVSVLIGVSTSSPIPDANYADYILAGVLGGLGASGLYSGIPAVKNG